MEKLKSKLKNTAIAATCFINGAMISVNNVLCDTSGSATNTTTDSGSNTGNAIWDVSDTASGSIAEKITTMYKAFFWPVLLVHLVIFVFVKDDKKKGMAKYTCIAACVLYIFCLLQNLVTGTLTSFASFFGVK